MTVPVTNVRLSADIQVEFGGTNPAALGEYYRGGANVPASQGDAGYGVIAASGPIYMGTFRNQTKAFTYTETIGAGNVNQYNLRTRAMTPFVGSNGATAWDGVTLLNATITNNGIIYSTSTSVPAFQLGSIPAGSSIVLINNGAIVGAGGAGGLGGSASGATLTAGQPGGGGGIGMALTYAISITNNSLIGGGGGGGGGGGAAHSTDGAKSTASTSTGGGGGGGGRTFGNGGAGGGAGVSTYSQAGAPGASGTASAAGAPGAGGSRIFTSGKTSTTYGSTAGAGGAGGGPGASGANGTLAATYDTRSAAGTGGSPGFAITGYFHATLSGGGTIAGTVL